LIVTLTFAVVSVIATTIVILSFYQWMGNLEYGPKYNFDNYYPWLWFALGIAFISGIVDILV
jgi:hypothetical protein